MADISTNKVILTGYAKSAAAPGLVNVRVDDQGAQVLTEKYAELATRGKVFHFSRAAITLPVNVTTLVSLMGLYNPAGSGVMAELVELEAHAVVATTVVDGLGVYWSNGTNASGATFTTAGTAYNSRIGEGAAPTCTVWNSVTHVGTPVLADLAGGWGAVSDGGATAVRKQWNGKLQVPPGTLVAVAMTTAAATASGVTALLRWAEVPYVSP